MWRAPVAVGLSSPVVANGRVYVTDVEYTRPRAIERIRCFDETSGRPLWIHENPVDYPDWAYTPEPTEGPRATPLCHDGALYALGGLGTLLCLDAATGMVSWTRDLSREFKARDSWFTPSPLLADGYLLVITCGDPGPTVVAFDPATGTERWRALEEPDVYSSPILVDRPAGPQVVLQTLKSVSGLDLRSGELLWSAPVSFTRDFSVPTPVGHGDFLFLNGLMLRYDPGEATAKTLWPAGGRPPRSTVSNTSTGLFLGDHLYAANLKGHFLCIEPATGRIAWETDTLTPTRNGASLHVTALDGPTTSDPGGAPVYIFNDQGDLLSARLSPAGCTETSRSHLIDGTYPYGGKMLAWAPPAFANGRVFVRNHHEIVCADLRHP